MNDPSRTFEVLLRQAVQALAQPSDVQESLFPKFVAVGDELALQFDDALSGFNAHHDRVTEAQRTVLNALDEYLTSLSGPKHADFWDDLTDARWAEVRVRAASVLDAFEWPLEIPPKDGATYVSETEIIRNR